MQFSLALYGSFPDTNGYTWKNPAGLNTSGLEKIKSFFSNPPQDGRKILPNDCIGGFYLDPVTDTFYAFRFINGGCDSHGRDGVVITNWVVCKLSEVLGKNIEELFSRIRKEYMEKIHKGLEKKTFPEYDGESDMINDATEHESQAETETETHPGYGGSSMNISDGDRNTNVSGMGDKNIDVSGMGDKDAPR